MKSSDAKFRENVNKTWALLFSINRKVILTWGYDSRCEYFYGNIHGNLWNGFHAYFIRVELFPTNIINESQAIVKIALWCVVSQSANRFSIVNYRRLSSSHNERTFWKGILRELLWFIRGSTNAKELAAENVRIWDANGSREFLDKQGLHNREEGKEMQVAFTT